jgi:hypothetical protein
MSKIYDNEKREYLQPIISVISLDNEISLQLESTPPIGPNETKLDIREYFGNNPFKSNEA